MSELLEFILNHEEPFKSKARLASLYADFASQKSLNPDGYQANVSAWKNALFSASRAGLLAGPDGSKSFLAMRAGKILSKDLQSTVYGQPLALGSVMDEAVSSKDMIPLKDFLEAKASIYQKPWVQLPTPWQGTRWILKQVGLLSASSALTDGSFVLLPNVEATAHKVLAAVPTHGTVFSHATFRDTFGLTPTDTTILLTHLARDRQAATFTDSTIKLTTNTSTPPTPITQTDTTIAQLNALAHTLSTQTAALETRIAALDTTARAAVLTSKRPAALAALRSKKLAESTLQRRLDSLAQVETTRASIDDAVGQVEMVRAMEASAGVLRTLNKEVGGVEGVDAVMDALREETGKVDEVGAVLREDAGSEVVVDEDELDEELEALEREQKQDAEEEERRRKVAELPSAGVGEPGLEKDKDEGLEDALEKSVHDLQKLSVHDTSVSEGATAAS